MLAFDDFKKVVELTPLVSIDLVVKDLRGQVLLGKRTNRPAQGNWFVPGGRIVKDESFENAFRRLVENELGSNASNLKPQFLGLYQHFYPDNFSGDAFTTHYAVLAYALVLDKPLESLPKLQHSEYRWFSKAELLSHEAVHEHTKWYFQAHKNADSPLS